MLLLEHRVRQLRKRLQKLGQILSAFSKLRKASYHLTIHKEPFEMVQTDCSARLTTRITGRRELTLISNSAGHRRSRACDGYSAYVG